MPSQARRKTKIVQWSLVLFAIALIGGWFLVRVLSRLAASAIHEIALEQAREAANDYVYPLAPTMPPIVEESLPDLLTRLDAAIKAKTPSIAEQLRPGLSPERIAEMEQEYSIKLTPELRQLYEWHNGTAGQPGLCLSGYEHFPPLEQVLAGHRAFLKQSEQATPLQKEIFEKISNSRKSWLEILPNGAGDGYFVDLARTPEQGAVFYSVHDDFHWVFYPSLKNLIAAIAECYESDVYPLNPLAPDAVAIYERAVQIHKKYGSQATENKSK